jgi:hypothetical protein
MIVCLHTGVIRNIPSAMDTKAALEEVGGGMNRDKEEIERESSYKV